MPVTDRAMRGATPLRFVSTQPGLTALSRAVLSRAMLALPALLAACGQMQVRSLATGAVERPAYQLSGASVAQLRGEAQRLCPNGADILRQSQRTDSGHDGSVAEAWYGRWWQQTRTTLAPESKQSQLMVLCQPLAGSATLAKVPDAAATAASAALATVSADKAAAAMRSTAPVGEGDLRDGLSAALAPSAVRSTEAAGTAKSARTSARSPTRAASAPLLTY